MGEQMTLMDWATLSSAVIAGAYLLKCRQKMYFALHDWKILAFHIGLMGLCATAVTSAWHGKSGLSILGVAVTVLWLMISHHSWQDGTPEHFNRKR